MTGDSWAVARKLGIASPSHNLAKPSGRASKSQVEEPTKPERGAFSLETKKPKRRRVLHPFGRRRRREKEDGRDGPRPEARIGRPTLISRHNGWISCDPPF